MAADARPRYREDDVLTVAEAARIACRSVRTIRRAYRAGRLLAHRDGNGRGISILYRDLRAWQLADDVTGIADDAVPAPVARVSKSRAMRRPRTGNLDLLTAARRSHRRAAGRARGMHIART